MAVVKLAVGAELDLATGDELKDATDSILGRLDKRVKPIYTTMVDSATGDGVQLFPLDLGSPPVGRMWNLRSITVVGLDAFTAPSAAKFFAVYFGDAPAPGGTLSLAQLKVANQPIPSTYASGSNALWVHSNENIIVATNAALTATERLVATAEVQEWRVDDVVMRNGR